MTNKKLENEITKYMVKKYQLQELGFDFMGYYQYKNFWYTYHHLIIPNRAGGPRTVENGAILFENSHAYLHRIEQYDKDRFDALTYELSLENSQGYLGSANQYVINDILTSFEREYSGQYTRKGIPVVKEEYTKRLIRK